MRLTFNTKKTAAVIAAAGLSLGLLGMGVGASFTDGGSATQNVKVGTFAISVSSTTSGAIAVNSAAVHTVTLSSADILSSVAGSDPLAFSVTSTGSIPAAVHVVKGAAPTAPLTDMMLAAPADVNLNPGLSQAYSGGIAWPILVNADLGKSAAVTYTITASEVGGPAALPDGTAQIVNGVVDVVNVSVWKIDPSAGGGATLQVATGDTLYIIGAATGGGLVATAVNGKISYHGTVTGATHYLSLHRLGSSGNENYWFPLT